jgi:hypothetical protein
MKAELGSQNAEVRMPYQETLCMEVRKKEPFVVIPEVVIGNPFFLKTETWIPACAGMTAGNTRLYVKEFRNTTLGMQNSEYRETEVWH